MIKKQHFILLWWLCIAHLTSAQVNTQQQGKPIIQNYSAKEYNSHQQIWSMVQDKRGFMYFGTDEGLVEYDGVSWRQIATPNNKRVRSLAADKNGVVYLGLSGDFGYLAPNKRGYLAYQSLLPDLPKDKRRFSDIWTTVATQGWVHFITMTKVYSYRNNKFVKRHEFPEKTTLFPGFNIDDTWYQPHTNVGIDVLKGEVLNTIKGSEKVGKGQVFSMLPYPGQKVLIQEANTGFWLYDKRSATFTKFDSEINHKKYLIYCSTALPNGWFAFGTRTHGVLLMDKEGKLLSVINRNRGLCNNTIWSIYHQKGTQNLWVGTDNGIAKVMYDVPMLQFDASTGLEGAVIASCRFQQKLYVSTTVGVFRLDPEGFTRIKGIKGQTINFTIHQHPDTGQRQLLVGSSQGLFAIKGNIAQLLFEEQVVIKFLPDRQQPTKAYLALLNGIGTRVYKQGKWQVEQALMEGLKDPPLQMIQDKKQQLWFVTHYKGAGLVKGNKVTLFDSTAGLPTQKLNMVSYNGKLYYTTPKGIYSFDANKRCFVRDYNINQHLGYHKKQAIAFVENDSTQTYWLAQDTQSKTNLICKKKGSVFIRDTLTLKALYEKKVTGVNRLLAKVF
ncbi:hypothetical protein [uncultured Microscilla sp.]|uniref:hypothetical protein n=1 Tax=uncultured Microscilla sp. TaxID=432653 RepID=UPI00262AE901|nr:hypothetical protein [uncultured Microscilla sp.]